MHRSIARIAVPLIAAVVAMAAVAATAFADDAPPPPPPQGVFIGKGQFGFLESKGNSDSESINGNLDVSRFDGLWKNDIYLAALYGKNRDIVSAERWEMREQTNYTLSASYFVFGGLRFEHDMFDGFQYQASVTGGVGYKIINTPDTALTAQLGAGFRRIRPETLQMDSSGEVTSRVPLDQRNAAIGTAELDFMHKFSPTTTLTNKFYSEAGAMNTMFQDQLQLAVKMTTKLALTVGYAIIDNTDPPPPLKKLDELTTVNVQFSF